MLLPVPSASRGVTPEPGGFPEDRSQALLLRSRLCRYARCPDLVGEPPAAWGASGWTITEAAAPVGAPVPSWMLVRSQPASVCRPGGVVLASSAKAKVGTS